MTELPVQRFPCPDGVELAWREVGSGRPFILLHGLTGSGALLAGQALVPALAGRGYRVILPDLRGHGDSGRPHDPACYPPDILADDMLALIGHLALEDYDLGGYSMGGKLVLRLLARGARPAHAVVGGQCLDALEAESDRTDGHRRILAGVAGGAVLRAGSPEGAMADWIRQSGVDARAAGLVLDTFVATPAGLLRRVSAPTLVILGDRDSRAASAGSLAALLPHGRLVLVPGDHVTAPGAPQFTAAVLRFLGKPLSGKRIASPRDYTRLPALVGFAGRAACRIRRAPGHPPTQPVRHGEEHLAHAAFKQRKDHSYARPGQCCASPAVPAGGSTRRPSDHRQCSVTALADATERRRRRQRIRAGT
jgi:pimeloyl-ACP methyl ester carboxylesterase